MQFDHDISLNTAEAINPTTERLSSRKKLKSRDARKKKQNKMCLVQNGKHVDLIYNEDPWFMNNTYTDVKSIDDSSHQSSNSKDKTSIPNIEHMTQDDVGASKYVPYTLMYLLIFFAVLLLIYKLGSR